jgi:hypothetical protein
MSGHDQSAEQFQSLLDTVEELRKKRYPHLSAAMVRELLGLHAHGAASDGDLARGAEQVVERHLPPEG